MCGGLSRKMFIRRLSLGHSISNFNFKPSTGCDYLDKIKTLANALAAIQNHVSDYVLVRFTLSGLGDGYESFTRFIPTRSVLPTFDQLHALLLNQEYRLHQLHSQAQTAPRGNCGLGFFRGSGPCGCSCLF